ncbi:MAG: hypothetical protein KDA92_13730 [Planctomycetales bacterium]|nr:hypothetical protein [Planctomycetales bacterium]
MSKKSLVSALFVLTVAFIFGGSTWSYLRTAAHNTRAAIREQVPLKFEIQRAEGLVADLIPEIRRTMHSVSIKEVELEQLDGQIQSCAGANEKLRGVVLTVKDQLTAGTLPDTRYSREDVEQDLAMKFERYKSEEARLVSLEQLRSARSRGLTAARQQLQQLVAKQREMSVQLAKLDTERQRLETEADNGQRTVDSSVLASAQSSINEIRSRLAVADRLLKHEQLIDEGIDWEADAQGPITNQIADYFSGTTSGGHERAATVGDTRLAGE